MNMSTLLSQEVMNRFLRLPATERADALTVLMRITVQVTRELMHKNPDSVDEFLFMTSAPTRAQ